jgi:hypothetical protein
LPPTLLLSLKDAALALAVSQKTLWRMTQPRGPIPAVRLGGSGPTARSLRYSIGSLLDWVEAEERKGQATGQEEPAAG